MRESYTEIRMTAPKLYVLLIFMELLPLKITTIIKLSPTNYTYVICLLLYVISVHKNCTGENLVKKCYFSIKKCFQVYIMKKQ